MMSKEQRRAIKEIANRLAWHEVWEYEGFSAETILVVQTGPGRTVSQWHFDRLVERIQTVLGPSHDFIIEGIEDSDPDTWVRMVPL